MLYITLVCLCKYFFYCANFKKLIHLKKIIIGKHNNVIRLQFFAVNREMSQTVCRGKKIK